MDKVETHDPAILEDVDRRLKWLIFFRAFFGLFLLLSTVAFTSFRNFSPATDPRMLLYLLSGFILFLTLCYSVILSRLKRKVLFTYIQLTIDTLLVTLIIYITGCFSSVFSFLYLIVVISSCFFLFRKGGVIIAALCSIEYGLMLCLEYYGVLKPFAMAEIFAVKSYGVNYIFYKIFVTSLACFTVAFLTSLLVEQERRAKRDLWVMRKHVSRVQRLAAVGEMAAGLAHEIKNPLAALTGAIDMLKNDLDIFGGDSSKLMRIIEREAKRLNSLLTNFLLFARPDKGKPKAIPLGAVVAETVDLFEKGLDKERNVECSVNLSPDIWVEVDPEYLRQVLWNLLLNAADAIYQSGKPSGEIIVNTYTSRSGSVHIEVVDNGCGVPEDVIDYIFDPFFTTKSKGTGLGLSVVHRLVESFDGCIDVETRRNEGTRFRVSLAKVSPPEKDPADGET